MYVDPSNYDTTEDAVHEFASELDPSTLFLEILIGGGRTTHCYYSFVRRQRAKEYWNYKVENSVKNNPQKGNWEKFSWIVDRQTVRNTWRTM